MPVTLRQALCHRAGVPAIRQPLTNSDLWRWERMAGALAAYRSLVGARYPPHLPHQHVWPPDRRDRPPRQWGDPWAINSDRWPGRSTPTSGSVFPRHLHPRCADIVWNGSTDIDIDFGELTGDELMIMLSYFNPAGYSSVGVVNTGSWRSAEVPSTNGHGTARGIALLYAALTAPPGLLSADLLAEATVPQSTGFCPVLGEDVTFGLGFTPTTARRPFGPNPKSFGHFGTGGAVGFADPQSGCRLRLRDERCHPPLAEHQESSAHRRPLRVALSSGGSLRSGVLTEASEPVSSTSDYRQKPACYFPTVGRGIKAGPWSVG